jgi:hypothetical protein
MHPQLGGEESIETKEFEFYLFSFYLQTAQLSVSSRSLESPSKICVSVCLQTNLFWSWCIYEEAALVIPATSALVLYLLILTTYCLYLNL